MKHIKSIMVLILLGILFVNCDRNPTEPENEDIRDLTTVEKNIVDSDNVFGLKLFQNLINDEKDKNVFISPLSIAMALGMTLNGADGETKQVMQQTLEVAGLTDEQINSSYKSLMELLTGIDPKVQFQIANSIWYRSGFTVEQPFIDVNQQYFNSLVTALDFNDPLSVNIINTWVSNNTKNKIDKIIDHINPMTVMFLINAIYFKGTWTYQFDTENTVDSPFYLPDNTEKICPLMKVAGTFNYFSNEKIQAVDLPYGDKNFSMTVILPKNGIEVDDLIGELSQTNWNNWIGQLSESEGEIFLPRFKLEYKKSLIEILAQLGMGIAFTSQADFTRINSAGNLFISEVKHKSFVEVNEEGTEAAAVTSVEITFTAVGAGFVFRANRPFIFVIREKNSGTILFIGKIVDPT
jgi:serine protease inhibitor